MIEIELKYFGAFRDLEDELKITRLEFENSFSVPELKAALGLEFKKRLGNDSLGQLIFDSAVATEDKILLLSSSIDRSCTLMILPPVCGG